MANFDIKIVSDAVCPWCYVGKKKLEKGIELYKAAHPDSADKFSITWAPFYLDPNAPKTSVDKLEFYHSKFGPQRAAMAFQRLSQIGSSVGINFKFGGRTGNTRDAHRLIQLGKTKSPETQTKVVEALFEAYFENEQDITSREVLQKAGEKAGLDAAEVKDWLASGKGGDEVDREVRWAQEQGISGVPNFIIQNAYEVNGAQDSEVFKSIFEKIKESDGGWARGVSANQSC